METTSNHVQLLLEQTTSLYNWEKQITQILSKLRSDTKENVLIEGLAVEAEENKKQCFRLEGLIAILTQRPPEKCNAEDQEINFFKQAAHTLKRMIIKHQGVGYRTAIFVALALGQNEAADLLRQVLIVSKND